MDLKTATHANAYHNEDTLNSAFQVGVRHSSDG